MRELARAWSLVCWFPLTLVPTLLELLGAHSSLTDFLDLASLRAPSWLVACKVGGVTKAPAQPHPASVVQIPEVEIFFLYL